MSQRCRCLYENHCNRSKTRLFVILLSTEFDYQRNAKEPLGMISITVKLDINDLRFQSHKELLLSKKEIHGKVIMISKLEYVYLLYLFGYMFQDSIMEQYVYARYADEFGFNHSSIGDHLADSCRNITKNSRSFRIEKKVQQKTSSFMVASNMAATIPTLISVL